MSNEPQAQEGKVEIPHILVTFNETGEADIAYNNVSAQQMLTAGELLKVIATHMLTARMEEQRALAYQKQQEQARNELMLQRVAQEIARKK